METVFSLLLIMLKQILTISTLFVATFITAQTTRLEITSLPSYHASESNIYAAGSFNGWNPQDENYKFKKDEKGNYFFLLHLEQVVLIFQTIEFFFLFHGVLRYLFDALFEFEKKIIF